jgi:hypothetical protein
MEAHGGRNMHITVRGVAGQIHIVEVRLALSLLYTTAIALPEAFESVMRC